MQILQNQNGFYLLRDGKTIAVRRTYNEAIELFEIVQREINANSQIQIIPLKSQPYDTTYTDTEEKIGISLMDVMGLRTIEL